MGRKKVLRLYSFNEKSSIIDCADFLKNSVICDSDYENNVVIIDCID
mgnify:CR=1 FL=1|jgi:hypothetical protein